MGAWFDQKVFSSEAAGPEDITTTSRNLRSTTLRLERARGLLERAEQEKANAARARNRKDSGKSATSVPHESLRRTAGDAQSEPEAIDEIEDVLVSPEGIDHAQARPRPKPLG